jgi:hypothetical protein
MTTSTKPITQTKSHKTLLGLKTQSSVTPFRNSAAVVCSWFIAGALEAAGTRLNRFVDLSLGVLLLSAAFVDFL